MPFGHSYRSLLLCWMLLLYSPKAIFHPPIPQHEASFEYRTSGTDGKQTAVTM